MLGDKESGSLREPQCAGDSLRASNKGAACAGLQNRRVAATKTAAEAATEANGETGWMQSGKTTWRTKAELRFQADENVTEGPRRCARGLALGGEAGWFRQAQWLSGPATL